jgi:hypothetical protein
VLVTAGAVTAKEEKVTKLIDAQKSLLRKAAAREDGAATPPAKLNKSAATKLATKLVELKLMREILTKPDMPVWRKNGDGRSTSFVITRAGRKAAEEASSVASYVESQASKSAKARLAVDDRSKGKSSISDKNPSPADSFESAVRSVPRASSKQALVLDMLKRPEGATLEALVSATSWLPHAARAALTVLRRRGFAIARERGEGGSASIYRIAAHVQNAA